MKRSERMMARLTGRRGEQALAGAALAGLAASAGCRCWRRRPTPSRARYSG